MNQNLSALTDELEFPNGNWKQWWYKTGPILLKLMTSSNYSIERQHQYLGFYARVIIPFLGPYPQVVRSSLTRSGLLQPTVRIAFEPLAERESIHLDATEKAILQEIKINDTFSRAQTLFSIDFVGDGAISVKAYSSRGLLANTVQGLQRQVDCSEVFSMVDCYLQETNSYNPYTFFSWDCIKPSNSRLKLYMCSASMMRAKLEDAWSLGSRLQGPSVEKGLQYLLQLHDHIQILDRELEIKVEHDDRSDTPKTTPVDFNLDSPRYDLEQTERLTSWISFAFTEFTGLYLSIHYHSSTDNPWAAEEKQQPSLGEL
ncbi:tryptophan dimethylallyltransferase-domain-containing protein [Aspergillus transmontanensis]|uniref:Tryptophan dimethylallyltransferase-domain-containing protein n=1 Tax=Aspergillus transmontanensis TaxID=1034304 RepID=A0A5N6VI76_9EURO|nr:tryptophan dimethylallyltransferase-domain-containing protein [Aspergillus transmontanensis]